ncbi:MAG TPA: RES family NAD+ phosphorylase [Steroidobacteraceae bacterium]|nr:RES family NAD+ phosphorylase [Steroidobacteraceae bacterium]
MSTVAKFPNSPGVAALAGFAPATLEIPKGTCLARVYTTGGRHPMRWNAFRYVGPVNARWDHHLANADGEPCAQERGIYYAARDAKTCLAESFQHTRRIDRAFQSPWLVVFETVSALRVLDLTGDFATRMGASMAIHSGSRERARGWARDLYAAFPEVQGIQYASSMNGGAHALALNERALQVALFPSHPLFNRALADDVMLDPLKQAGSELGYALR